MDMPEYDPAHIVFFKQRAHGRGLFIRIYRRIMSHGNQAAVFTHQFFSRSQAHFHADKLAVVYLAVLGRKTVRIGIQPPPAPAYYGLPQLQRIVLQKKHPCRRRFAHTAYRAPPVIVIAPYKYLFPRQFAYCA